MNKIVFKDGHEEQIIAYRYLSEPNAVCTIIEFEAYNHKRYRYEEYFEEIQRHNPKIDRLFPVRVKEHKFSDAEIERIELKQ